MGVLPARPSRSPGVRRGVGQLRSRRGRCGCGHDRTDPFRGDNPVSPARPHLQRTPSLRPNREPPKRTRTTGRWIIGSGFARRTSLSDHGASTDRRCSAGRRYAGYLSKFSQTTKSRGGRGLLHCARSRQRHPRERHVSHEADSADPLGRRPRNRRRNPGSAVAICRERGPDPHHARGECATALRAWGLFRREAHRRASIAISDCKGQGRQR